MDNGRSVAEANESLLPSTRRRLSKRTPSIRKKKDSIRKSSTVYGRIYDQKTKTRRTKKEHSKIYDALNHKSRKWYAVLFKYAVTLLILTDVVFFFLSTVPSVSVDPTFYVEEGLVSSFFLVEYVLRVAYVTESRRYGRSGPVWGRLRYVVSLPALVDAFATFPFFLEILTNERDLPKLTFLRFFRLARILRTDHAGKSMESVRRVLYYNSEILYVACVVAFGLIVLTAVLLYWLRPPSSEWSMFTATYFSTLLLTGQGGPPDEGALPWYTRAVVLLTSLFSVGMFAVPSSMLTWGFEAEAARVAAKTRKRFLDGAVEGTSSSSSSSSGESEDARDDLSSSDEEYLKQLGDGTEKLGKETFPEKSFQGTSAENMADRMDKLEEKVDEILRLLKKE